MKSDFDEQIRTPLTRALTRIEEGFGDTGGLTVHLGEEDVPAEEWRRLMRMVAKRLGRPVETFATETSVVGALKDWPCNASERQRAQESMRRAVNALSGDL